MFSGLFFNLKRDRNFWAKKEMMSEDFFVLLFFFIILFLLSPSNWYRSSARLLSKSRILCYSDIYTTPSTLSGVFFHLNFASLRVVQELFDQVRLTASPRLQLYGNFEAAFRLDQACCVGHWGIALVE